MKRLLVLCALAALAGACAPVLHDSPPELDRAAKEFRPTPGMTTLYVFRDKTKIESGVADNEKMQVTLDGNPLGVTRAKTFLVAVVAPGPHALVSMAAGHDNQLQVVGNPGEILYVYQEALYVVGVTSKLHLVDAAEAHPRIRRCDLAPSAATRTAVPPAAAEPPKPPATPPGS